jgi:hypothetical protein
MLRIFDNDKKDPSGAQRPISPCQGEKLGGYGVHMREVNK